MTKWFISTSRCVLVVVVILGLASAAAVAQELTDEVVTKREEFDAKPLTSKWTVRVGGSLSSFDTSVAWSPAGLGGSVILLEETLGLESSTDNFMLGLDFRFNGRHSIEFAATDVRRSALKEIDEEIEWGDYLFRAHGEMRSQLNMSVASLKYKYDFSDSGRLNAGFSAGLSTFSIEAVISGEARLEDDDESEWVEGVVERADVIAPVPVFGFFLEYAATPRWILRSYAELIDLEVGDHAGRLIQVGMTAEYVLTDTFGVGVGLGGIDLEYRGEKKKEKFGVDYKVKSLGAYLSWVF